MHFVVSARSNGSKSLTKKVTKSSFILEFDQHCGRPRNEVTFCNKSRQSPHSRVLSAQHVPVRPQTRRWVKPISDLQLRTPSSLRCTTNATTSMFCALA